MSEGLAPRSAKLVEAFASLQGEGRRVGERQVFLRFAVCDRKCAYCDTPESIGAAPRAVRVERSPGSGDFEEVENPLTGEALLEVVGRLGGELVRPVVSVTGGEPLLQVGFLEGWLPRLKERAEVVLETHGLAPNALARVVGWVDEVVMDVKLPSATGEPAGWAAHAEFVDVALGSDAALTVKAVVGAGTTEAELEEVLGLFARAGERAFCVLQPVSPWPGGPEVPTTAQLLGWQDAALHRGLDVRVIPQVHVLAGMR